MDFDGVVFGLIDEFEPERGGWSSCTQDCASFPSLETACTTADQQVRTCAQHVCTAPAPPGTTWHHTPRPNRAGVRAGTPGPPGRRGLTRLPLRHMPATLPDLTLLDTEGRQVKLRDLAGDRALILAYVRHFG